MIVQISFIPFDIGFFPDISYLSRQRFESFTIFEEKDAEVIGLLGADLLALETEDCACRFYLNQFGFGIVQIEANRYDDNLHPSIIGRLLCDRRQLHCGVIEGSYLINKQIQKLLRELNLLCPVKKRKGVRPRFWSYSPYVMSTYFLVEARGLLHSDISKKRALIGLVEPSTVGAEDTPFLKGENNPEKIVASVKSINPLHYTDSLKDHDASDRTQAYITWANVVVISESDVEMYEVMKHYSALEVRLQLAWIMAYYINKWKDVALDTGVRNLEIEETKWNLVRIHRNIANLLDASIATRFQQIFDKLVETSGLPRQISEARDGLEVASQYVEFIRERRETGYKIIVEICLFVFGLSQIIPLLFKTPIVELPAWSIAPLLALFIFLVIERYRRSL